MSARTALAHAAADEIALYVMDALAAPARQRLEGHLGSCAACAGALAAEAAAEEGLRAVWEEVRRPVGRPLADVVALPRKVPPPARARPPAVRNGGHQGSMGALAAAVVTVLFLGWWTDAGRLMTSQPLHAGRPTLTACLLPGTRAAGDDSLRICTAPPSLGAMASWGMCALGTQAGAGGVCALLADPVCALPESE